MDEHRTITIRIQEARDPRYRRPCFVFGNLRPLLVNGHQLLLAGFGALWCPDVTRSNQSSAMLGGGDDG